MGNKIKLISHFHFPLFSRKKEKSPEILNFNRYMNELVYFKISVKKGSNVLQVYAIDAKKPSKRKRKSINTLLKDAQIRTHVDYWNDDTQLFKTEVRKGIPIPTAEDDNKHITNLVESLKRICTLNSCTYNNVLETYIEQIDKEETHVPTLLEYARTYTEMVRTKTRNEAEKNNKDTNNWKVYLNVVHKLEGKVKNVIQPWANEIQRFANQPINEINNNDFNEYIKFLEKHNLTNANLVTNYRTIVYDYHKRIMRDIGFQLHMTDESKNIHNKAAQPKNKSLILNDSQLKQLIELDVTLVLPNESNERKTMYKDVLLSMYLLYSRPMDITGMRIENLDFGSYKKDCVYWTYLAGKKANQSESQVRTTPVSSDALEIIEKYKGSRKKGYVFQFRELKEDDAKRTTKLKRLNQVNGFINKFLQAVGTYYGWKTRSNERLSMYSMRRTAINNALRNGITIDQLEKIAHTSSREIKETYQDAKYIAEMIPTDKLNSLNIA